MKIIKRGKKYPRRVTCNECFSILEYELDDLVISSSLPSGGVCGFIVCPVCGDRIYLF